MIRFANPGADIEHMVAIFKKLYAQLSDFSSFDLNNMADVMTSENMASSKGYVGEEALKRSYAIKDFSRNPLYNQAKMYAEVYRMFGWMNSAGSALEFNFTLLGAHVAISGKSTKSIIELCLLGIYFPNELLDVRFTNRGKPYVSILKYFYTLDVLYRDEMILGALNLSNSEDELEFQTSVKFIKELREAQDSKQALQNAMDKTSAELGISCNTMRNYTRILIAALKYTEWAEEIHLNIYGNNTKFFKITNYGKQVYEYIKKTTYLNKKDLEHLSEPQINAICKIGFLNLLKKANFSVDDDLKLLDNEATIVSSIYQNNDILFNPFQTYSKINILKYFPEGSLGSNENIRKDFTVKETEEIYSLWNQKTEIGSQSIIKVKNNKTLKLLNKLLEEYSGDEQKVLNHLLKNILQMKQTQFYPLVAELLGIIFHSEARAPQAGVNNERFDVIIPDEHYSIPVEVKSPTEEIMLSVKAVRQALENKIILLSRKNYKTDRSISSIAVGFNIPNKRSDVYLLIEDIKKAYDINIAIISIDQLITAAIGCLKNSKKYNIDDFKEVYGVIKFENL